MAERRRVANAMQRQPMAGRARGQCEGRGEAAPAVEQLHDDGAVAATRGVVERRHARRVRDRKGVLVESRVPEHLKGRVLVAGDEGCEQTVLSRRRLLWPTAGRFIYCMVFVRQANGAQHALCIMYRIWRALPRHLLYTISRVRKMLLYCTVLCIASRATVLRCAQVGTSSIVARFHICSTRRTMRLRG